MTRALGKICLANMPAPPPVWVTTTSGAKPSRFAASAARAKPWARRAARSIGWA